MTDVAFDPHFNQAIDWTALTESQFLWDFMSYACRTWISATNWTKLATRLTPGGG